jgi:hypothetical protein
MADERIVDTNNMDDWGRTLVDNPDDISYASAVDSDVDNDDDDNVDDDDDRSTRTLSNIRSDIKVRRRKCDHKLYIPFVILIYLCSILFFGYRS